MKKLFVLLVVAALTIPASAAYIGFDDGGNSAVNYLKVDLNGAGAGNTITGFQGWMFARDWTGPLSQQFVNPNADYGWEQPIAQLEVYRKNQGASSNAGASRDRSGGWAGVLGTGDFSYGTEGFGMNYVKLTLTQLQPDTDYRFYLWSYEAVGVWVYDSTNPYRKYVAFSTTNPKTWLDAHKGQYRGVMNEPNGYGPRKGDDHTEATTDSNMPGSPDNTYTGPGPSLYQLMGCRVDANYADGTDHDGSMTLNVGKMTATTNDDGACVIYAWMDATDFGNSMHVPLNAFLVVPEPTTIALLGLGGLALLRRKRA